LKNYRKRLKQRGVARFEVLGLDADRELVRSFARRFADNGPDSTLLRAAVCRTIAGESPDRFVSRYLLDTNVIGNVTKPIPSEALIAWMAEQADGDLFISALTVAEILRGLMEKPAGRKRTELERWFAGPKGPQSLFAGRVLPFDEKAGLAWARLMAHGNAAGRPRNALDTMIAAVAEVNDCVVVTDNEKDFPGLKVVNPLRAAN
jgi:predicted nucleic acid-binding protein